MKSILVIASAAALLGSLPVYAQTSDLAVAPAARSTGPTIPDTRQVDQNTAAPPSTTAAPPTKDTSAGFGNWRASDGLNADPNNPNGAPGPSSIGTNPSR